MTTRRHRPDLDDEPQERALPALLRRLFFASLVAACLFLWVVQSATIAGASMEPRLGENDRVLVNKLLYGLDGFPSERFSLGRRPRRGDVVVANNPLVPGSTLIKRVVGCPGERLRVDEHGRVFVDGAELEEPYAAKATGIRRRHPVDVTLGPEEYFLLGDNREFSTDSRDLGPIAAAEILGAVSLRYWPIIDL